MGALYQCMIRNPSVSLVTDAKRGIYLTGYFSEAVEGTDFDASPSTVFNMNSVGQFDAFVTKYNGNGNFQWAFRSGGEDYDYGYILLSIIILTCTTPVISIVMKMILIRVWCC